MHPSTPPRPDLDGIEARANAATPGPWRVNKYAGIGTGPNGVTDSVIGSDGINPFYELGCPYDNLGFIAAARQDVPALVAYARSLEAEAEKVTMPQIIRYCESLMYRMEHGNTAEAVEAMERAKIIHAIVANALARKKLKDESPDIFAELNPKPHPEAP